jgi:hypothetical protein
MLKRWAAWPLGIRWLVGIAAVLLALAVVWTLFVPTADWPLSDNGTMVGVKWLALRSQSERRLTPLAVPMSLGAGHGSACNGLIAVGEL